jgi:2EXR family
MSDIELLRTREIDRSRDRVKMTCTTPGMLHATSESRAVALKYYALEFTTFLNEKPVYFDVNRDMLFLVTAHTTDSFCGVFMTPSISLYRSPSLQPKFKHPQTTVALYEKYIHKLLRELHQIQQSTLKTRQNAANTVSSQNEIEVLLTDTLRSNPVTQIDALGFGFRTDDQIWARAEKGRVCISVLVWLQDYS